MSHDIQLDALMAQIAEMRATLAAQEAELAAQETAFNTLFEEIRQAKGAPALASAPQTHLPVSAAPVSDAPEVDPAGQGQLPPRQGRASRLLRTGTSRRGLLRGAAASAAAATVGAIALSGAQPAHAAPETTGQAAILGQSNDASAVTSFTNTTGTTPAPILQVGDSNFNGSALAVTSGSGVAITGTDTSASAPGGTGISGTSNFGYGVQGTSTFGTGVYGFGILGQSTFNDDLAATGTGRILQKLQSQAGAPASGTHTAGESIRDSNGELWLCMSSGAPGVWAQVVHLAPGAVGGGMVSYLSKPIRLFDSRVNASDALFHPGVPCASSNPTTLQVSGDSFGGVTVPATVAGAIGNVTVLNEAAAGYLELVPSGAGFTGAANLAFAPGQIISNAFNVGLSNGGALDIIIGGSGSPATDVIVDLFAIVV